MWHRSSASLLLYLGLLAACRDPPAPPSPESAPSPVDAPRPATPLALVAGAVSEHELSGGEAHHYRLDLDAGQYASLVVDQLGIDVELRLAAADGRSLTRIDSPNGPNGPEPMHVVADSAEPFLLEVRSGSRHAAAGGYAVKVEALRPATARDRQRTRAERTFATAEGLRRQDVAEASERAEALYRESLGVFRRLGDHERQADVLERLGRVHEALGDPASTIEVCEQALELYRALGDERKAAAVLNTIGKTHRFGGRYREAVAIFLEVLELYEALDSRSGQASTLVNLGRAYTSLGRAEEALSRYEQALALYRQLGERDNEGVTLSTMGLLHARLGRYELALDVLGQALAVLEAQDEGSGRAVTLTRLGTVCNQLGRPDDALAYLQRALPLVRRAGNQREEAVTLIELGTSYHRLGRAAEARQAHGQALALARELGDPHSEAVALANLAAVDLKLGRHGAAEELYREALALLEAVDNPQSEASVLLGLARARRAQGDPRAARRWLERALDRIEWLRSEPGSSEARTSFFAEKRLYYEEYADLLMELHSGDPRAGYDVRAFEVSERVRARSLLDLMAESAAGLRDSVDPRWLDRENGLRDRLNQAERRRTRAAAPERSATEVEVGRLLLELERLRAEIRRAHPRYAQLTQGNPLGLEAIRSLLGEDTVLLEYFLGARRSFVWVVSAESLVSIELPPRSVIEPLARRVHRLLAASRRTLARAEATMALDELSHLLLTPVAGHLARRRLLVVADGALHYVPFAALALPRGSALVHEHELVTLPSASSLAELRRARAAHAASAARLAVLADPVFDAADPRVADSRLSPLPDAAAALRSTAEAAAPLPRLPFSRIEAEAILELVPEGEGRLALDFEASRELVTSGDLRRYRLLHFATHGVLDSEYPELSGLAFSMVDEAGRPRDGLLRTHDVSRLDLPAELVALSACRTALGKEVRGEGLIGLTRGFMIAGARRVLVTLWQVEDRATAEFMALFYRRLLVEGDTPGAALRHAQSTIARTPGWEAPYYWAGFVLQGAD